ncbi:hypothetical protein [Tsukamurella sp. NPDC003166]|uniref:hypothetical protein n=1 Tax=Tsukamurella sp. NPDC003166 TaxID=3154444 RepID=UPI0033B4448E
MTATHQPELFKPLAEVAPLFGHHYEWLLNRCKAGAFPHHKIGRRYFMTDSDIAAAQALLAVGATEQRDPHGLRPRSRAHLNGAGRRRR